MRKLPARKLLGAIVAAALLLPSSGFTLGLGEIEVNSALNQKLNADIELLSAAPEDAEGIIIKLASRKEFSRAGIDRPYLLNDLRFKSEIINGVPHIKVSSGSPIREPFLNFLVEIDWPNGHLLREYTILLDPPVFMTQPAASTTSSAAALATDHAGFRPSTGSAVNVAPVVAPVASISPRPSASVPAEVPQAQPFAAVEPMPVSAQSTWIPAPVVQQQASINQPAGTYKIKNGDTAWSLADAMRPDRSITVPQMMVAMLRANPGSFIDGNINGLKRGYILRVPDYAQITSVSTAEAQELVREQAALWRQYQQSQAGATPTSAMEQDAMPASAESGSSDTVTPQDDAYLEIISAGTGSSTTSGKDPTEMSAQELRAELALARERVETELVEKEALQQRVDVLESNVNKMKGMLAIEDAELAAVESLGQSDLAQAEEMMPSETELVEGEMPEGEVPEGEMSEQALMDAASTEETDLDAMQAEAMDKVADAEAVDPESAETMADESLLTKDEALLEGETLEGAEEAVFTDEMTEETDAALAEMQDQAMSPDMEAVSDSVAAESQMADREPADLLSKLLNNPMLLAAVGGGLLLITALIGLIFKRRKSATDTAGTVTAGGFDDLEVLAEDVAKETAEMESAAEEDILAGVEEISEESFDSDATMILDSAEDTVITEVDSSAADTEEARDDVIAEADVYLAYGIYQQAEELLTQAISDSPDRDDYRVKLAETHFASKNSDAFTQVASEIKGRVEGDSATWKKVLSMGQELCPDNPMFQGDMVAGTGLDSMAPAAPEMDFDLGLDDTAVESDSGSPDLDLSLDDKPLELPEMDVAASELDTEEETEIAAEPADELEFDLSDAGAIEEPVVAEEDEFSLDIDASELDIDIDMEDEVAAVTEAVEDVDLDFGLGEDVSAADVEEEEDISLDLTEEAEALDMDLGELTDATETKEEAEVEAAPIIDLSDTDEEDFDLSSLDDVDEISTKLDLARAYLDMGDNEGSKGILEEVIAEGNDEQKQEAKELMEKLD